ncbi:MAG TPA: choice-of-anchor E domain-containing protein [Verrucomicrobiae bacterium]|nr:choice-of-anchor E domain-containing protein [Verrucomicrobiae bacterium]
MAFYFNRAGFLKTGILGFFLLASGSLRAALVSYSAEFPATDPGSYQATAWDQTLSVPQFDPRLGRLEGVTILLEAAISVTQGYENLSHRPGTIHLTDQGTVSLSFGRDTLLTDHLQVSGTYHAAGYDGHLDFGGTSGATIRGLTDQETRSVAFNSQRRTSPFVGHGNVNFDVQAEANDFFSDHDGHFAAFGLTSAWGEVSVLYDFIPVPETSTIWVGIGAIILLAAIWGRRAGQFFR